MPLPRIETANAFSLPTFRANFLSDYPLSGAVIPDLQANGSQYAITIETPSTISPLEFTACFDLVASTSSSTYSNSSKGWSPNKKRKEMRLPDLRYLLLKQDTAAEAPVEGFISFMLTYEDGQEVIYCYEIHLTPQLCGLGIGKYLMGLMEGVGRKAGVEKAMLTVFRENQQGLAFYEKLGYSADDFSPQPRKLRNGVIKKADYSILSKPLK